FSSVLFLSCLLLPTSVYSQTHNQALKKWTIIIYIAADNDLRGFAARNIKQMASIGSNANVNICVELHIRIAGNKKISRRYYIEPNQVIHVNGDDPLSQRLDSGDEKTLIGCCEWAIKNYPAQHYGLILWNHGTGICEPMTGRIINPNELFTFNPAINKFELDRSVGFLDIVTNGQPEQRGICWDDSSGNYISNAKLVRALSTVCTNCLHGKKFSFIGFDACLMAMLEVGNLIKSYAHIMIGSQEVEMGTGWNYQLAFQSLQNHTPDPHTLARNIVDAYQRTYHKVNNDYTLSAVNLDTIQPLEDNVHTVAQLLTECLKKQKYNFIKSVIQASLHKDVCTHFDEPSYIDLHHFYTNLLHHIDRSPVDNDMLTLKTQLRQALIHGCALIKEIVFANTVGDNVRHAKGLSIYFASTPESAPRIHYSYRTTPFALTNEWINFMSHYLAT
ncbi:MAG: clostripain-related cysteine peptidase, partial [Candidatus Babeliales bacterium]